MPTRTDAPLFPGRAAEEEERSWKGRRSERSLGKVSADDDGDRHQLTVARPATARNNWTVGVISMDAFEVRANRFSEPDPPSITRGSFRCRDSETFRRMVAPARRSPSRHERETAAPRDLAPSAASLTPCDTLR